MNVKTQRFDVSMTSFSSEEININELIYTGWGAKKSKQ